MRHRGLCVISCALALWLGSSGPVVGQETQVAARGPRFLAATPTSSVPVPLDARRVAVLRERISLDLTDATLQQALAEITRQSGLRFMYSKDLITAAGRVQVQARRITVAAALTELLVDAGVDVVLTTDGQAMLARQGPVRSMAQQGSLVGRITDAKTSESLAGAEAWLEGTRFRATSGENGRYRLTDVPAGTYMLSVRRVGYVKQVSSVAVRTEQEVVADVALQPVATQLDELVTTVTGDQRRVELGHVVGRINADSLVKEAPVTNLGELLNGRVPGLQVFQSQGTVGGDVKVQVRGANSMLLATTPIVVVDGVRYTSEATGRPVTLGMSPARVEPSSPLNDINPNDIEVVKGPSAATLYGTDAANGVIVIRTKRGQAGPARWNAYGRAALTSVPSQHYPDVYWGWGTVFGEPNSTNTSCSIFYIPRGWCTQQDSVTILKNPLNDPQLSVLDSRPRWDYGMNVAGGREDLQYYFSGDFEQAVGPLTMPPLIAVQLREQRGLTELPDEQKNPNQFTKANLRATTTARFSNETELRLTAGYTHRNTRTISVAAGGLANPYAEGSVLVTPTLPYGPYSARPDQAFAQSSDQGVDRFVGSANGQWRPVRWLLTRATIGLDLTNSARASLARSGALPNSFYYPDGAVEDERTRQVGTSADLGATATARKGRVSFRTSVGAQYVRTLNDGVSTFGQGLPPGGTSVGEAASVRTAQTYHETVTLGSFIEEAIGLNDRLFLTGAVRIDGASAFGRDYNATAYPKVSLSWLVSEEPFLRGIPHLDELRLRSALGASGLQPQPEWARPTFRTASTELGGGSTTVIGFQSVGNPNLRPERVRELEAGFDAAAFNRRVQLGITWYERRTVDQIASVDLPPGLGSMYTNLGLTTQHGFELELSTRIVETRALTWDVLVQHSLHRTKLVDVGGGLPVYRYTGGFAEGYPLGARFVHPVLGYADANGDGIIGPGEVQVGTGWIFAGETTPPSTQTLATTVGLFDRRVRLTALLDRRTGYTQHDRIKETQCFNDRCREVVDLSTPLDVQADIVSLTHEAFIESGTFTRLREVSAVIDLPSAVVRALRVRSATLGVSARNLALWSSFTGPDPESADVSGDGAGAAEGIPQARSWAIRFDLGL